MFPRVKLRGGVNLRGQKNKKGVVRMQILLTVEHARLDAGAYNGPSPGCERQTRGIDGKTPALSHFFKSHILTY
jgi:hypothetical protein